MFTFRLATTDTQCRHLFVTVRLQLDDATSNLPDSYAVCLRGYFSPKMAEQLRLIKIYDHKLKTIMQFHYYLEFYSTHALFDKLHIYGQQALFKHQDQFLLKVVNSNVDVKYTFTSTTKFTTFSKTWSKPIAKVLVLCDLCGVFRIFAVLHVYLTGPTRIHMCNIRSKGAKIFCGCYIYTLVLNFIR